MSFLFEAFARLIETFYAFTRSYGLSIVLLTVAVRLVLFPLTAKQARSMQAMQRVQPELKRLQQKYKNDRQKLNEEMMKFYKENQINPLAGCLPLLLQMPLFIILYRVIHGLTKFKTVDGRRIGDPSYISHGSELYQALRGAGGKMVSWGLNLSESAKDASSGGFGHALPYFVLVALVVGTGYYQQKQMTAKNPQAAQNPQAQMMGRVFPLMFGLISYSIQAGVVLYFLVSNTWQIAQQAVIFRNASAGVAARGADDPTASKPAKESKPPADGGHTGSKPNPAARTRQNRQRKKGGK